MLHQYSTSKSPRLFITRSVGGQLESTESYMIGFVLSLEECTFFFHSQLPHTKKKEFERKNISERWDAQAPRPWSGSSEVLCYNTGANRSKKRSVCCPVSNSAAAVKQQLNAIMLIQCLIDKVVFTFKSSTAAEFGMQ